MTAQHLFWNHVLGLRTPDLDRRIANELMARMRDDGTWSIWFEGSADLSTSIEAYVALRDVRRRPGRKGARVHPARGRHPEEPALHEVLPRAARPVAVAADGPDPAGARAAATVVAVLDLQLRVLGAADVRRARGRAVAASGTPSRHRPVGDRCDPGTNTACAPAERTAASCAAARGAMDPRAAGGRRLLGRDPAAVGVGDRRSHRARARLRGRHASQGGRGLAGLHGRGRRPPSSRGVPVAGVGHRARRARAPRVRRARTPSATRRCGVRTCSARK